MHGWDLAALLIGVFWLGGYLALLGRAMLDASRLRREGRDVVRQAEQTLTLERDSGHTKIVAHMNVDDLAEANARLLAESRGTRMRAKRLLRRA